VYYTILPRFKMGN